MGHWGLTNHAMELFDWLDVNGNGKITYEDMANTLANELRPDAMLYFRQDGFSWKTTKDKSVPCSYPNCWSDMRFVDQ